MSVQLYILCWVEPCKGQIIKLKYAPIVFAVIAAFCRPYFDKLQDRRNDTCSWHASQRCPVVLKADSQRKSRRSLDTNKEAAVGVVVQPIVQ